MHLYCSTIEHAYFRNHVKVAVYILLLFVYLGADLIFDILSTLMHLRRRKLYAEKCVRNNNENIIKFRTLHFPLMTYSAIIIFIYCFTKIFFKLRHNHIIRSPSLPYLHVSANHGLFASYFCTWRIFRFWD